MTRHTQPEPYLAARIRAVHAAPAEKLDDLLIIAVMVERMERQLDDIVATAAAEERQRREQPRTAVAGWEP